MRYMQSANWKLWVAAGLMGLGMVSAAVAKDSGPIKIALIASKTGPAEQFGRESERGVRVALDLLTNGTMQVQGRPIELIVKDDQFKPELSKALLAEAYADDEVDIAIGTSWSGGALAMAPVAQEYEKVLFIDPAVADALTGSAWNRYLFRVNRNSYQDAMASAALVESGDSVAFLAPDYVFGKDGVTAFKEALRTLKIDAAVVHEEFVPQSTTDFTASMQRILGKFNGASGKKYIVVIWGAGNPSRKISELVPSNDKIEFIAVGGANHEHAKLWTGLPMVGGTTYFFTFPKNPMNDAFVAEMHKRYGMPPDAFTASAFTTVAAILAGIEKAGSTDAEALIAALEGLTFDSVKGALTIRKEDHQALQSMYIMRMKEGPGKDDWDRVELVREIPAEALPVPITVKPR